MSDTDAIHDDLNRVADALRAKLGLHAKSLQDLQGKARRRLPGHIHTKVVALSQAEQLLTHPKLSRTLDSAALSRAADEVQTHLDTIDLSEKRKDWWLGMLGGLAFNMIAFCTLLVVVLVWRGYL